jgi:hypothetical protein
MDIYEVGEHRFIVRIYVEETQEEAGFVAWRGTICHVGVGREEHIEEVRIKDLNDILNFIASYLQTMGVRLSLYWRLKQWWKRLWADRQ